MLGEASSGDTLTAFHVEAAIAAVHATAPSAATTPWPEIVALYDTLLCLAPSPIVGLNCAIALAEAEGPERGMAELAALDARALESYVFYHAALGQLSARAGDGMVHTVSWRVASGAALDFWERRLADSGVASAREDGSLAFVDPEGLRLELVVRETADAPLVASHPEIPAELALQGFDGVRAYAFRLARGAEAFAALGFEEVGPHEWEVRGATRGGRFVLDEPPPERGIPAAGTVHHVAFAVPFDEHASWVDRVREAGMSPTPVIDRFYFRAIYAREPNGVLFEFASIGPGFATDEAADALGERLSLPPAFEHLRARIEPALTPLTLPPR